MIISLFNRRRRKAGIEPLYGAMMANALDPQLFLAGGIPDTFEGRFESVALQAALVLRRLKSLPAPAGDIAQELVDRIFDGLDAAMREAGVSDVGVPKRIKTFAQGFYGRLDAYTSALDARDDASLKAALQRNITGTDRPADWLCAAVHDLDRRLATLAVADFAAGALPKIGEAVADV